MGQNPTNIVPGKNIEFESRSQRLFLSWMADELQAYFAPLGRIEKFEDTHPVFKIFNEYQVLLQLDRPSFFDPEGVPLNRRKGIVWETLKFPITVEVQGGLKFIAFNLRLPEHGWYEAEKKELNSEYFEALREVSQHAAQHGWHLV